jgi:hypothetical protein
MSMNPYIHEKLRDLDQERLDRLPRFSYERPRRRAVFGPMAAFAGRTLRRAGEGLETWATLPAPADRTKRMRDGAS